MDSTISSDMWKLLGALAVAITGLSVYIKTLITGNAENIKNARAECKNEYDAEIARLTESVAAEKNNLLVVVDEKNKLQREYIEFVKSSSGGHGS